MVRVMVVELVENNEAMEQSRNKISMNKKMEGGGEK